MKKKIYHSRTMKKRKVPAFNQLARQFGCLAGSVMLSMASFQSATADGIGWSPGTKPGQILANGLTKFTGDATPTTQYAYVYVKEGESLSYEIQRSSGNSGSNSFAFSVYSPLGQVGSTETILGTDGTARIAAIQATAATAGIWIVQMIPNGTLTNWRYDINAISNPADPANSRISGRVYTEILSIAQGSAAGNVTNIPLYLHTPSGHKYDVLFNQYNGVLSRIKSDQFGIVSKDNCGVSYYQSTENTDTNIRNIDLPTCGVQNKLFFSPSDPTLPVSAPMWDISAAQTTTDWLNPNLTGPVVTELAYTSANGANPLAGNFTFKVSDHVGSATLQLDLDNDGIYGGANDRNISISVANDNTISVPFDGLNAGATILPQGSTIKAKVLVDKAGEVHFTLSDVEYLSGVKITRTTGDPSGSTLLYWNDSQLTETGRASVTPQKDGTAGVDSNTANGVHGWPVAGSNQWADDRLIDNWTYAGAAATQEITVENCAANAGTISR